MKSSIKEHKGNMYEGVVTYNPLGGECSHICSYCSTNALKKRYEAVKNKYSGPLQLYFDYPKGTDRTVFVVAQNDLFAENVPTAWIVNILQRCKAKDNIYLFQSKNPARMKQFAPLFPEKSILCTTIETNRRYAQMGNTPDVYDRAKAMNEHWLAGFKIQVTLEPLFDFDLKELVWLIQECHPDQINIGADSKHHNLPEPSKDKVLALIDELQKFTTIARKTNLARLLK
jgi:DNA repair photolyase